VYKKDDISIKAWNILTLGKVVNLSKAVYKRKFNKGDGRKI